MEQVLSIFLPAWDIELLQRPLNRPTPARPERAPTAPSEISALRESSARRENHSPPPFSAAATQRSRGRPALLLVASAAGQDRVLRCCAAARAAGVRPHMTLAEARGLAPHARVAPFDPARSRSALQRLAAWCRRFSPVVALDPDGSFDTPDGLLLDVTGTTHLFGGAHLFLMEVASRLARLGFTPRLALAPTVGAAWAIARFAPRLPAVAQDAHLRQALLPLPVAALRLPETIRLNLRQVGVEIIGQLLALRRESLPARFGDELLRRLDQALGRIHEPLHAFHAAEPLAVSRQFDGAATQLEAILITVQELIAELAALLLLKESGVRGMRLTLWRADAPPVSQDLVLGRPSRDATHLWKLLRPKIENIHLGFGVEAVALEAHWTQTIRHQQLGAWQTGEADAHDEEFEAFLDTLVNRWGTKRVLAAQAVESHVPEFARQFRPCREVAGGTSHGTEGAATLQLLDRPSVLFEQPEPAEAVALQPDHPPSLLTWRGEEHRVEPGEHTRPERITTAWWGTRRASTRDYFKVQTPDGKWLWVFRELETRRWFVQGMWA